MAIFFANQKTDSHFAIPILRNCRVYAVNTEIFTAYPLQLSLHNNRKENDMTRLNKIIATCAATLVSGPVSPTSVGADTPAKALTVYAGPQSVSPGEPIYVSVEATHGNGESISNEQIALSYKFDGVVKTLSGRPQNGLVSFEVPAQTQAGHMTFTAVISQTQSNTVLVAVVAARPHRFSLTAERGEQSGTVTLSSKVITDKYGNPISDLSPVIIEWIDEAGLKSRETVRLLNGRVLLTTQCPASFEGAAKIKASLGALQFTSAKLNALCASAAG